MLRQRLPHWGSAPTSDVVIQIERLKQENELLALQNQRQQLLSPPARKLVGEQEAARHFAMGTTNWQQFGNQFDKLAELV